MSNTGWRSNRPLLICYAPVADPECTPEALAIYGEQGVDIVEIGIPTADPFLDGPTVAASMLRVMGNASPMEAICAAIDAHEQMIRDQRLRLVLMGYSDMPFTAFTRLARRKLIHGLIMPGVVVAEQSAELADWLAREDVKRVGFVDAGLSPDLVASANQSDGYVMLQSHDGPTGVREVVDRQNSDKLKTLRRAGIGLPIALGFGIGTPAQAAEAISLGADGVVVGSACIEAARRGADALRGFVGELRRALDMRPLHAESG